MRSFGPKSRGVQGISGIFELPPDDPETAANLLITLIHQAQFLLDRQGAALEDKFVKEGGYTENLFRRRLAERKGQ